MADPQTTPKEHLKAKARERSKAWYWANKDRYRAYVEENREHILARKKAYRDAHKEEASAYDKKRRERRGDELLAKRRENYAALTPEKKATILARKKLSRARNRDKTIAAKRAWDLANSERIKAYTKAYMPRKTARSIERNKTDPKFALNNRMRSRVRVSLLERGSAKGKSWESLVGYSVQDLELRLKRTMPAGYTWADFLSGDLHIDHRIPLAVFNFRSPSDPDFKRAWALSNLRLLPKSENMRKGARLLEPFQPTLI